VVRIGELASAAATGVETVRYYDKIGLLPSPARTSANYRAYGSDHLARLSFIRRARDLGFTLEAVREFAHPCRRHVAIMRRRGRNCAGSPN
jgi:DNA-binding transcriptional MerR regulator